MPHWLDLKNGDFRKSTAFKRYGVKTRRTSQYANEHGLPRPDSARFEHGGGSRSNTKGEYDFKNGDFRKSTAFKSYGVKTRRTSQYANEHGLPRPDSARFEHGGGSRSNTKGEYVVLVWQKHYLPT